MMNFLFDYGMFLAKSLTVAVCLLLVIAGAAASRRHRDDDDDDKMRIRLLNEHFEQQRERLNAELLDKKTLKAQRKAEKKAAKHDSAQHKPRIFVLDFDGDIEASAVAQLREQISAVIQVAGTEDRVLLRLESGGGLVHAYGLAASQLARLRERQIPLVIAVDKVAASGGYMMACLANELIAAPFAILGSVGVIGALPNFNELLKQHRIRYEEHTAGEHKRSLTLFGENTDADRQQFRHELAVTHEGSGSPWLTLQSLAAVPLKAPFAAGYQIKRSVTPLEQADKSLPAGHYSRGDILRVTLEVNASADMTWVAITDPVPGGATILGSGLGRDSAIASSGEKSEGWGWLAYEERSFESFRAYYEYLPKGKLKMEYTVRLNNPGVFNLPPTRVEALYAPEMFGEAPNAPVQVRQ